VCSNEELKARLDRIEECVDENHRALRGKNSETGLVGRVDQLGIQVSTVQVLLTNDMQHIKEIIETRGKYEHEKTVEWPYLLKQVFLPLGLAVVSSVVTAYLMLTLFGN
jgi:hypothetical protein